MNRQNKFIKKLFWGAENTLKEHKNNRLCAVEHELVILKNIISGTRAGTWQWNVQTGETIFNERWAEIVGYTLEELSPISIETWSRLAHPEELELSSRQLQSIFNKEQEYYNIDCQMKHKNGHWLWVRVRGQVISWTDDGKPLWMVGSNIDITTEKIAELELSKSYKKLNHEQIKLNMAQAVAHIGSWSWDLENNEVEWTEEMYKIFGIDKYTIKGRLGDVISRVIHPDDLHIVLPSNADPFAKKENMEYRIIWPDGSIRYISAIAGEVVNDQNGAPIFMIGTCQDITSQKLAEKALLEGKDIILAAAVAKSQMALLQSQIKPHFLYNSLSVIISLCYTNPEKAGTLLISFTKMLRRVFSAEQWVELVTVELELELVEAYVEIQMARFGSRLKMIYEVDQTLLKQCVMPLIIQPLVENAIRHGVLQKMEGGLVQLIIQRKGSFVKIAVTDNGVGIPSYKINKIMNEEATTIGVGIANINQRLFLYSGNKLMIESIEGVGTSVVFYMPLNECTSNSEQ
jgi:PAS domain S-box-containing protein